VAVRFAGPFALLAALFASLGILGAGCGSGSSDVCQCQSCSHPYGACPGETLPNQSPGESDATEEGEGTVFDAKGSENGNVEGRDAGDAAIFDAEVPDAFPASCAIALRPDAAPHTCAFTPADVFCNMDADCFAFEVVGCCGSTVVGVNKTSTASCPAPPCVPPDQDADCPGGWMTQDCRLVPNSPYARFVEGGATVAVACVDHQCMTYATGP
jgi:hypothetical protein